MARSEMILSSLQDEVLTLTLNRPHALNTFDLDMASAMTACAAELPGLGAGAKVVVLRGAGDAFCSGGDVAAFAADPDHVPDTMRTLVEGFHTFVEAIWRTPQPVVCAVDGVVAGGGLSLALACDLVLAARTSVFAFAYRQLGASPDGGLTWSLPRLVGRQRAFDLLLAGQRRYTADEAMALGLVISCVAPDELEAKLGAVTRALCGNSAPANAATKALLRASDHQTLPAQLAAECAAFVAGAGGPDFLEGVNAFLGKRPPRFGVQHSGKGSARADPNRRDPQVAPPMRRRNSFES